MKLRCSLLSHNYFTRIYYVLLFFLIFTSCCKNSNGFNAEEVERLVNEGDIAFRRGHSAESRAVLHFDSLGMYSHIGIVVLADSVYKIIHCVPGESPDDRIKMDNIGEFFAEDRAGAGAIARLPNRAGHAFLAARYAHSKYREVILFDHDYDLDDTTRMYCSELVWKAYLHTGIDITARSRTIVEGVPLMSGTYIMPSDIYANKELNIIYQF